MEKLELEKFEVIQLNDSEKIYFGGGGVGPLWWPSMIRAGMLSRMFIHTGADHLKMMA